MMGLGHRGYRKLVDKIFMAATRQQPRFRPGRDRLFAHLRGDDCARCRAYYEARLRAAGGDEDTLSPAESRAMAGALEEQFRGLLGLAPAQPARQPAARSRRTWLTAG